MKQIAQFFTLYWIIYFPTCIAYNNLPGFSSVDEVMTGVLFLYTFSSFGKKGTIRKSAKEYYLFWAIISFYTVYSLMFGANVAGGVWLDFIQEIRPYTIIYCTWILNPQFSRSQKNLMLATMVATLFSWIIYHPETLDVNKSNEFPVLGQLAICTGMSWYLLTKPTKRNKYIALVLVLTGMLAPKFKFLGEVVAFVYMIFFLHKRFDFKSPRTMTSLLLLVVAILFVTWSKFDAYYVSGMDNEQLARPMTYKTAFGKIIWDYFPFGSGMGTFACNGAWKYYSPLYPKYNLNHVWGLNKGGGFICDAYYPTLAQFGVVGIYMFYVFWKRRLKEMSQIIDMRYYRVAWLTFFCVAIEQTADSSWLSGKGMGYCMLLGLCLCSNNNISNSTQDQIVKV